MIKILQVTLETTLHAQSMDHLQIPSTLNHHHSKNTSHHHCDLKKEKKTKYLANIYTTYLKVSVDIAV